MYDVTLSSYIDVQLIRHNASDDGVIQAAQVSVLGENNPDTVRERLIKALMKDRHGSPFEHNSVTMFVEAPLFVIREWQRHRIGSFNEMSGRYTEMSPRFYIPNEERSVINSGTSMRPEYTAESLQATTLTRMLLSQNSRTAWRDYQNMLDFGVAKEVARMVLPLNIYSQMYWTVNARSLMNFISLRVESDDSLVKSYPQHEIHLGAVKVEEIFKQLMPITHEAFVLNGRVAP